MSILWSFKYYSEALEYDRTQGNVHLQIADIYLLQQEEEEEIQILSEGISQVNEAEKILLMDKKEEIYQSRAAKLLADGTLLYRIFLPSEKFHIKTPGQDRAY